MRELHCMCGNHLVANDDEGGWSSRSSTVLPRGVRFVYLHPPANQQEEAPLVLLQDKDLSLSQRDKGAGRRAALDLLRWEGVEDVYQGQEPLLHRHVLSHGANVDPERANDLCPPAHDDPAASSGSSARGSVGRGRDLPSRCDSTSAHTYHLYVEITRQGHLKVSVRHHHNVLTLPSA